jgi:non-homologous end joining protein Ku
MIEVAKHILQSKAALASILRAKQAVQPSPATAPTPVASPENVIQLMDALRRSLVAENPLAKDRQSLSRTTTGTGPST